MRRANLVPGLAISAAVLGVLAYTIGADKTRDTVDVGRSDANQLQQASSAESLLDEATDSVSKRSSNDDLNPTEQATDSKSSYVDEETDRRLLLEDAQREVPQIYALLLEKLELTPGEKDALLALLVEDYVASTRTRYSSGLGMDEQERSARIATIIGESKLQRFLAMERSIYEFGEAQRVESLLQRNGVPFTGNQRDELLDILVELRAKENAMPVAEVERGSIESLKQRLAQIDEYDRHVLELAPSVLSPEQVRYLFEQYQALSYERADALEKQIRARVEDPSTTLPLYYPARDY